MPQGLIWGVSCLSCPRFQGGPLVGGLLFSWPLHWHDVCGCLSWEVILPLGPGSQPHSPRHSSVTADTWPRRGQDHAGLGSARESSFCDVSDVQKGRHPATCAVGCRLIAVWGSRCLSRSVRVSVFLLAVLSLCAPPATGPTHQEAAMGWPPCREARRAPSLALSYAFPSVQRRQWPENTFDTRYTLR